MSDYSLEQMESRLIAIGNGNWRSFVVRVISLPDNTCVAQHLIFANLDRRGDVMRKRLSGTQTTVSEHELLKFAEDADERELQTTGGRMVVRRASRPTVEIAWIVRLEFGAARTTDIASDKSICGLNEVDLSDMAGLFNQQLPG